MTKIVHSSPRERHRYAVRTSQVLDGLLKSEKASWLARAINVPESVLSECRGGSRNLPFYLAPLIDEAMGGHVLLEELAAMEGCGVHELEPEPMSAGDLERIFPAILREEGATNAEVFDALHGEHVLDETHRAQLHAHFTKLRRYFAEAEERTAPMPRLGRTS